MVAIFRINTQFLIIKLIIIIISILTAVLLISYAFEAIYRYFYPNTSICGRNEKIDVVYTWVNGSDTKFLDDLNLYFKSKLIAADSTKQRFDDKYELKFSLRSIEKFAPWINHVYIVTNGQIPYWLNLDYEKVSIITHEEIFKDTYNLPTFSSPAIECNLHRIPGLTKRFIYFNDDVFLGSEVYLEDFYSPNRGFLIYLAWPIPPCSPNCPWMYVHDGQCDKHCNNPNCQMDGGDCELNEKIDMTDFRNEIIRIYHRNKTESNTNETNFSRKLNSKAEKPFQNILLRNLTSSNLTYLVLAHNELVKNSDKLNRRISDLKRIKRKSHLFRSTTRLLADAYSASLQYTNKVFNLKFGYKTRKVPPHAPILIDKYIMEDLQNVFEKEFKQTERNRVRSSNDMQFSFSYYYFLMAQQRRKSIGEIFDDVDTDGSGTWSDREIRTLLTKLYELPLSFAIVDHFEDILLTCLNEHSIKPILSTPLYERYVDSRLPTITKEQIINCKEMTKILLERFENVSLYKYEEVRSAESRHVSFKMLISNITDVVSHLDDIRSDLKKFVCLNDNLDELRATENDMIKSILYDFYISIFPHPSKFELPKDYRNKFMYISELNEWKQRHYRLKLFVYGVSVGIMYFTFFNFCKRKLYQFVNKLFFC